MGDLLKKLKDVFVTSVPDTSATGKVDKTDIAKVAKTGVLVGLAAGLSWVVTNVAPDSLGPYQPVVILGLTMALDFVNKLVKQNQ